jgi:hypothetical protein
VQQSGLDPFRGPAATIRMALGDPRRDVMRLVLLIGPGIGLAGSLAVTRFLSGLLVSVTAIGPLTFAGVISLLGLSRSPPAASCTPRLVRGPTVASRYKWSFAQVNDNYSLSRPSLKRQNSLSEQVGSALERRTPRATSSIASNIERVQERIARAGARSDRRPKEICSPPSKTFPAEAIRAAYVAGIRAFGENRVRDWEGKQPELAGLKPSWRLFGFCKATKRAAQCASIRW